MHERLEPKDHRERTAIFRSELVGALTHMPMDRGELRAELLALSKQRFMPPGADRTRTFSIATLERWYYAYKKRGLAGLMPKRRKDKGRGRALSKDLRSLVSDIRREHPLASASLILRTLVLDGRVEKKALTASTLRRFFVEQGLDRKALRDGGSKRVRLRWQAERPSALWHADVCHGPTLLCGERRVPMRIHAIMDDCSRYVVSLRALEQEREVDMLEVFLAALRRFGHPDVLYLDNGATYRGDVLRTACARLGTSLVHAKPYDPEARGKMERFWRTLREGCLDFCGQLSSLHDVNARLLAFVDLHYHRAPHGSLMGKSPEAIFLSGDAKPDSLDEQKLKEALTVRSRRRVRRDSTLSIDGVDYEVTLGFLSGSVVTVAQSFADPKALPWVEHNGKTYPLDRVDPIKNAKRRRSPRRDSETKASTVAFDPTAALLDMAAGRTRNEEDTF